jgi:hypothetical protein
LLEIFLQRNTQWIAIFVKNGIDFFDDSVFVFIFHFQNCFFVRYDPRLTYLNSSWKHVEDITLHYDLVNKVWTPDAFFRNSKDARSHMVTVPNRLIRIFPEGRVLYSQRLVNIILNINFLEKNETVNHCS